MTKRQKVRALSVQPQQHLPEKITPQNADVPRSAFIADHAEVGANPKSHGTWSILVSRHTRDKPGGHRAVSGQS